ncbi:ADP-ribosylation_factor [Hexamita inflata]|uniref:ADP-ribosylation factor n=1 Tax=Hexamita inflata TaxID=28002 RepID=A0AA86Q0G2_9EUKA|nr:ADP-ribosylation factor [Hexamita inflata]
MLLQNYGVNNYVWVSQMLSFIVGIIFVRCEVEILTSLTLFRFNKINNIKQTSQLNQSSTAYLLKQLFNQQSRLKQKDKYFINGSLSSWEVYNIIINQFEITEFKSQPSFGYDFQTMQYKNIKFIVCGTGGQSDMHQFLITQNLQIDAIIFVVDSADIDPEIVCEAKTDLNALILDDRTINATILMFANKQDRLKTMTVTFLTEKLELDSFNNQYHSQACSANTGQGLEQGLFWLCNAIKMNMK